jgi:hypothetical protein
VLRVLLATLHPVHLHDVVRDSLVLVLVLLIRHNEEQVKARHDGRGNLHIVPKRLCLIVAAHRGISSCKN